MSGCGGSGGGDVGSGDSQRAVAAAADKTVAAGTARINTTYDGVIVGNSTQDADFRSDRAGGTISYDESSDEAIGPLRGMDGEIYVDGADTFMKFPSLQTSGWIEIPRDPTGSTQNQPSRLFSTLDAALDDVTEASSGPEGTTFEGRYDLNDLFAETVESPEELAAAEEQLAELSEDDARVPVTIVVGDDGTITALTLNLLEGTPGEITMMMEVGRLGERVDIGPPPRDFLSAEELSGSGTG